MMSATALGLVCLSIIGAFLGCFLAVVWQGCEINSALNRLCDFLYAKIRADRICYPSYVDKYVKGYLLERTFTPQAIQRRDKIAAGLEDILGQDVLEMSNGIVKSQDLARQLIHLENVLRALGEIFVLDGHKSYVGHLLNQIVKNGKPLFVDDFLELLLSQEELNKEGHSGADSSANNSEEGSNRD